MDVNYVWVALTAITEVKAESWATDNVCADNPTLQEGLKLFRKNNARWKSPHAMDTRGEEDQEGATFLFELKFSFESDFNDGLPENLKDVRQIDITTVRILTSLL